MNPLKEDTKQKVIELYSSGCTNPYIILKNLNAVGVKISYGSVYNLCKNLKKNGGLDSPATSSGVITASLPRSENDIHQVTVINLPAATANALNHAPGAETGAAPGNSLAQVLPNDAPRLTPAPGDTSAASAPVSFGNSLITDAQNQDSILTIPVMLTADVEYGESNTSYNNANENIIARSGSPLLTATILPPHTTEIVSHGGGLEPIKPILENKNPGQPFSFLPSVVATTTACVTPKTLPENVFEIDDVGQIDIVDPVIITSVEKDTSSKEKTQEHLKLKQSAEHQQSADFPPLSTFKTSHRTSEDCPAAETSTPIIDYWSIEDSDNSPTVNTSKPPIAETEEEFTEEESSSYAIDWLVRAKNERQQRQEQLVHINKELELIKSERRNLELEKQLLNVKQDNIVAREDEMEKFRDVIPSAKQLKEMGMGVVELLIYIELVKEKASMEGVDERTAASLIAQDLKSYQERGGIQKVLEQNQQRFAQAERELAMLQAQIKEKQQSIATLQHLKSRGINETDIEEMNQLLMAGGQKNRNEDKINNGSFKNNFMFRLDDKLLIKKYDANN
jgi:hypothetical protein